MSILYILEGKEPKPVDDASEWGRWFEKADRHVAKTELRNRVIVSTVFLGLDHSFGGGIPILFETMIFGGKHNHYQERYATWEEAEAGHLRAIKLVKGRVRAQFKKGSKAEQVNPAQSEERERKA